MRSVLPLAVALAAASAPSPATAQASAVGQEILGQFEASASKLVALAAAMPESAYGWRPMEGVASVADVYMHVARYNYAYPAESMGVPAPAGLDYEAWEGRVTDKDSAVTILSASMDHVRRAVAGMSDADLAAPTTLYGREVPTWAVLLQLVAHMNEHLGQSIAYARSNRVVPPWSR